MQHVKNAIGGNAMKMLKMHQNAIKCTRMRMGKINTTFGKKQQQSPHTSRDMICDRMPTSERGRHAVKGTETLKLVPT